MNKDFGNEHGITFEPPLEIENISLQSRLEDYYKLSDTEMLKKYGVKLTSEVWRFIWDNENENERKNPEYFHD